MKNLCSRSMIAISVALLMSVASITSSVTWANSNFVTNPYLPYPPSCARMPASSESALADTGAVKFYEGEISLPDQRTFEQVGFTLRAYRSPCSEAGRSLLWLEFRLAEAAAHEDIEVMLPIVAVDYKIPSLDYLSTSLLVPVSDPNSWGEGSSVDRERIMLVSRPHGDPDGNDEEFLSDGELSWWFLLDNESPLVDDSYNIPSLMPASAYNGHFSMRLRYPPNYHIVQFEVPSTAEMGMIASDNFPFTGRLSGNWVIEDANDQGFMLAISSWVTKREVDRSGFPPLAMVLFFSQYTFDSSGKMLWLTGSAEFTPGVQQVSFPIDEVNQGEFRSDQPAERRTIGQITLTANNCNDITMQYDYSSLGLGSGTKRLQRLISLETAGYDCRDYAARVEANP
jgi:hypothetical protein